MTQSQTQPQPQTQTMSAFGEALEKVDQLSLEDQAELVEIVRNRLRDRRRAQLIEDVRQARREYERGEYQEMSPEQIVEEALQ